MALCLAALLLPAWSCPFCAQPDGGSRASTLLAAGYGLQTTSAAVNQGFLCYWIYRWGQTPLDEAIRNRATKVAEYLQSRGAKQTQQ